MTKNTLSKSLKFLQIDPNQRQVYVNNVIDVLIDGVYYNTRRINMPLLDKIM